MRGLVRPHLSALEFLTGVSVYSILDYCPFLCFVLFLGSWGGIVSPGAASQICFGINVGKLTGFWFARGRRGKAYFLVTARNRKYIF